MQTSPTGDAGDLAAGVLVAFCLFFIVYIGLFIWSLVFIYRDTKARGENTVLWLVLNIFFFPIPWLIWLFVRPKDKVAPMPYGYAPPPPGPPPAYAPPPPMPPPYGQPPPYSPPGYGQQPGYGQPGYGYPPPTPPPRPAPAPPAGQPPASVRCPNCQTVFPYQRNPYGPSHVKCPNCGTEGTL